MKEKYKGAIRKNENEMYDKRWDLEKFEKIDLIKIARPAQMSTCEEEKFIFVQKIATFASKTFSVKKKLCSPKDK